MGQVSDLLSIMLKGYQPTVMNVVFFYFTLPSAGLIKMSQNVYKYFL